MDAEGEIDNLRRRVHVVADVAQSVATRQATIAVQVDNLVAMFTEHKTDVKTFMAETREALEEIREQTTRTNGRVNGHDREIKDIKDTLTRAIWWVFGINAGVVTGVFVYWVTHR